ncbi:MAG: molybdopterin biosynthesis protein MoeY, partial [Burkholderiaceae bacterium]|nr:molybdopterin biosynthesis protein MoeY [Burkholderiaceae bacterium]
SSKSAAQQRAQELDERYTRGVGAHAAAHAVFMGRVGVGRQPTSRSLRRPLSRLLSLEAK